jgi:serine protease inhibitor
MAMACQGAVDCNDLEYLCWPRTNMSAADKALTFEVALTAVQTYVTGMPETCKTVNILICDSEIKEEFQKDMKNYFNAKQFSLKDWETVNKLVTDTTQIQKKVLSREPSATTLIQAIFFQDTWAMGFKSENTKQKIFNNEKGEDR